MIYKCYQVLYKSKIRKKGREIKRERERHTAEDNVMKKRAR